MPVLSPRVLSLSWPKFLAWLRNSKAKPQSKKRYIRAWKAWHRKKHFKVEEVSSWQPEKLGMRRVKRVGRQTKIVLTKLNYDERIGAVKRIYTILSRSGLGSMMRFLLQFRVKIGKRYNPKAWIGTRIVNRKQFKEAWQDLEMKLAGIVFSASVKAVLVTRCEIKYYGKLKKVV